MKKKVLSFVLVLCMVIGMLPMVALAEEHVHRGIVTGYRHETGPLGLFCFDCNPAGQVFNWSYAAANEIATFSLCQNPDDGVMVTPICMVPGAGDRYFVTENGLAKEVGITNDYNIKLSYPEGGVATMYLKGAAISSANGIMLDVGLSGDFRGDGASYKIVVEEDSTVVGTHTTFAPIYSETAGTLTIEGPGKLNLEWPNNWKGDDAGYANSGILVHHGSLVLQNKAKLEIIDNTPVPDVSLMISGSVTVDDSALYLMTPSAGDHTSKYSAYAAKIGGDFIVKNNADVKVYDVPSIYIGVAHPLEIAGEFFIENSSVELAITNVYFDGYVVLNKVPQLTFATGYEAIYDRQTAVEDGTGYDFSFPTWDGAYNLAVPGSAVTVNSKEGNVLDADLLDLQYFKIAPIADGEPVGPGTETEPAETEPVETEPAETEPAETEPPVHVCTGKITGYRHETGPLGVFCDCGQFLAWDYAAANEIGTITLVRNPGEGWDAEPVAMSPMCGDRYFVLQDGIAVEVGVTEDYNIKLSYPEGGVMTIYLKNAYLHNGNPMMLGVDTRGTFGGADASYKIVVEEDSTLVGTHTGFAPLYAQTGGTLTIEGPGKLNLEWPGNWKGDYAGYANSGILLHMGDLVLQNKAKVEIIDGTNNPETSLMVSGDVTVDDSALYLMTPPTGDIQNLLSARAASIGGNFIVKNNADVKVYNIPSIHVGVGHPLDIAGEFIIEDSSFEVALTTQYFNGYVVLTKAPQLKFANGYEAIYDRHTADEYGDGYDFQYPTWDGAYNLTAPETAFTVNSKDNSLVAVDMLDLQYFKIAPIADGEAVDETCTHDEVTFADNGDGTHTATCAACGMTGTATHFWDLVNNVCSDCGVCKHVYAYTDNGDGTHTGICNNCQDEKTEEHVYNDETGLCWSCNAAKPCEHEYTYADNGDGTHTATCGICSEAITEAHAYDEAGNCACGAVKPCEHEYAYTDNGDGTHSIECVLCDEPMTIADHVFEDGECVCGAVEVIEPAVKEDPNLKLQSVDMLLNADIRYLAIFHKDVMAPYERVYVEIVKNGVTTTIEATEFATSGSFRATQGVLAAKEMADVLTITMFGVDANGDTWTGPAKTWSLKEAAITLMEKHYVDGVADNTCIMLANMLYYGEQAQKELKYNTDALATKDLDAKYLDLIIDETPDMSPVTFNNGSYGVQMISVDFNLAEKIEQMIVMKAPTGADLTAYKAVVVHHGVKGDETYTFEGKDFFTSGSFFGVYLNKLYPNHLRDSVTITIYEGDTAVSATHTFTGESSAAKLKNAALAAALMNYADLVKVVFG